MPTHAEHRVKSSDHANDNATPRPALSRHGLAAAVVNRITSARRPPVRTARVRSRLAIETVLMRLLSVLARQGAPSRERRLDM